MRLSDSKIINMYFNELMTCSEIAAIDGRSISTIYNIIKKKARPRNRSQANKIFSDAIIVKLYNIGLSSSQIGILLGIHPSTITKRLCSLSFPMRSRRMAALIKYNDNEFNKYFNNNEFRDKIAKSVRTT